MIDVPAKSGPIDLGNVILIAASCCAQSDTGVDVFTNDIPKMFGGVPLPLRKIEITVDRPGFFLNPTGCEPRPLIATFDAWEGGQTTSTMNLQAENCDKLPFNPNLRLIAGAPGLTGKGQHPPLTAIVTQQPGEANIKLSKTVLPDILRPNSPVLNEPGGLCAEAQFVLRQCPDKSLVGNARAITPVLPFELSGPVYIVQQTVDPLPRLYVLLRGGGFEVPLKARSFFTGIRTTTLFDNTIPDVPQQLLPAQHQRRVARHPEQLDRPLQVLAARLRPAVHRTERQDGRTASRSSRSPAATTRSARGLDQHQQVKVKGNTAKIKV